MDNINIVMKKLLICLLIFKINLFGQFSDADLKNSIMGGDKSQLSELATLGQDVPSSALINVAVDPKKYIVDSGDQFAVKIDKEGPAYKVYNPTVTPDGYIILPDMDGIYVKDMILEDANKLIVTKVKRIFPSAQVESFILGLHKISITLIGAIEKNGAIELNSSNRLFDAYTNSFKDEKLSNQFPMTTQSGELLIPLGNTEEEKFDKETQSIRSVKIIRNGDELEYDLLEFMHSGDNTNNPYLMHGDIIYFPFKSPESSTIKISGAVKNQKSIEFKEGDNLISALGFAGGLLYEADSSSIELVRFNINGNSIIRENLSIPDNENFMLEPNDRIYVRIKNKFQSKLSVIIKGEVLFPGEYAITEANTTLKEIIQFAGGLTENASLSRSRIIREYDQQDPIELNLLKAQGIDHKNKIEHNLLKYIPIDFKKLIKENDESQNIVLKDKDIIDIPMISGQVYVSGGVVKPGVLLFNENWDFEDYINEAGGYSSRAYEGRVKIIKAKTGHWVDLDDLQQIEENDLIFVPERYDYDYYTLIKEGLTLAAQVATLVLLYVNIVQ
jgi:protein involved in polysaccharide export with SLBB domain